MLIFPIKAHWFKMIDRGEKREEYREDTPYYRARLERFLGEEIECILRNGYSSASPQLKIRALVEYGEGKEKWGTEPGKNYFKLVILEKQRIQPETFIIKARRCKRCGGLLTSRQAVLDGYGHVCKRKTEIDEKNAELMKNQTSLFD